MIARLREAGPADLPLLLDLYLRFEPKAAYQGLPPHKKATTRKWLTGLLGEPSNMHFILTLDERVAAHAALVFYPDRLESQEIIIFVHQDYQHAGWGRKLFLATMNVACHRLKLAQVWLSVDWLNVPARRLYHAIGFRPVPDEEDPWGEITMVRPLQCRRCLETHCPIFTAELIRGPIRSPQ